MIAQSWFGRCWQWKIGGCVAIFGTLCAMGGDRVNAQIVPDNTLGSESSIVTPDVNINGIESDRIDGGAIRGANLFHSFEQLSVLEGRGAYFTNPAGIENILSRVTGTNRSEILGRLGVLGHANLFLINPKGIVFGLSSSLDLQGSFLATTADAVKLGDAGLFSATQPATSNLLTVSPSALWFNAVAAQPIVNRSQAPSLINQPNSDDGSPGLQVQPGRTLALIGRDVLLEGGRLTAAGGRIELGSVTGVGQVSLTISDNTFALGYDSMNNFGKISLSNGAFVDASGEGGGGIQIRGGRLEMTQGSNIRANTLGSQNGKQILVRATEVELSERSALTAYVLGTGTGGNLTIDTHRLLVRDGAAVSTATAGSGKSGSLLVTATDSVELIGWSADGQRPKRPSGLFTTSVGGDAGDAGDVRIDTQRLLLRDGAQVFAGTGGSGNGGSLLINASESVELIGTTADGRFGNSLSTLTTGSGNAGVLRIDTGRLLVSDGSEVSASTYGEGKGSILQITATDSVELIGTTADGEIRSGLFAQSSPGSSGDAGELRIDTGRLLARDGAVVSVSTRGSGKGGSLLITATDSVEVIGTSGDGGFSSGLFTESERTASGDAGDLRIDTGRLLVRDRAVISSRSRGEGAAGNIDITARDTLQANNGTIATDSTQSGGGAIAIRAGNIRLFGNSDIRSNVASGDDNGGSITLTADSIVAFDDSNILAFARGGTGGDVTLNTPAFFGENYRPAPGDIDLDTLNRNNRVDINATGAVSGVITIPDTTFIQNSLTALPENQIDTDSLLASSCIVRRDQPTRGSFTVTGTGGLQERPGDTQMSSFPTVDIETLPSDGTSSNRSWQKGDPIVEPQGVYRLPNGKIVLSRECS